ncbi:MAG: signal recognition particle receptor subunit alpha, partial [Acidiferrobacterales bacterium]
MTLTSKTTATGETKPHGLLARLRNTLGATRQSLTQGLANLLLDKRVLDEDLLEELETQLLTADVGVDATQNLIADITGKLARKELSDGPAIYA